MPSDALGRFVTSDGVILAYRVDDFTDSACDGKNYFGWPCDEETERLRAEYLDASDETTRNAILQRLSERLWHSFPIVLLGQYIQPYAWRSNVTGLLHVFPLVFWNVEKQ